MPSYLALRWNSLKVSNLMKLYLDFGQATARGNLWRSTLRISISISLKSNADLIMRTLSTAYFSALGKDSQKRVGEHLKSSGIEEGHWGKSAYRHKLQIQDKGPGRRYIVYASGLYAGWALMWPQIRMPRHADAVADTVVPCSHPQDADTSCGSVSSILTWPRVLASGQTKQTDRIGGGESASEKVQ